MVAETSRGFTYTLGIQKETTDALCLFKWQTEDI